MNITAQQIIDDYEATARQVLDYFLNLSEQEQSQHEKDETSLFWWKHSCQKGLASIEMMPPPFFHSSPCLVIDTWGWISPEGREQMEQENHPLYQAWVECQP